MGLAPPPHPAGSSPSSDLASRLGGQRQTYSSESVWNDGDSLQDVPATLYSCVQSQTPVLREERESITRENADL